ncbi:YuzB family protein [Shimazuella kribbensis]|uniref:YuzB family protein n=1 Tax=Shimazuella kribbensis TaxID=139808 RepID=UPI00048D614A|nr:YuzB family protein [Shimazuella kribbensis]
MRPLIEFCVNNLTSNVLQIKAKLESNLDYDVLEYGCLGNCGICARSPYALVNGELVTAETAEELYKKIIEACEEMEFRY